MVWYFRRALVLHADMQSESARVIFFVDESSQERYDEHHAACCDLGRQQRTGGISSIVGALGRQGHTYTWR